jgi:acetyltransferase
MTIRNLDAVLRPRSIAVIGASERPGSIGRILLENLAAFRGDVFAVNPRHERILGHPAYASIAAAPRVPDLAVIATPADTVAPIIAQAAEHGVRGAVVISAGLGEQTEAGRALRAVLDKHRHRLLRVVGPNTLGIAVPPLGVNASFAHLAPAAGGIAFVAQSGAIVTSVLDWATARNIGFSHLVALGDMLDVDFGDMLDYLAGDAAAHAILLYMEAVTAPRKFMSAARAAARMKPVIVVKGGRHAGSATAAASHTGRLAGNDSEYTAAFRRAGMLRVASLDELFDAVETLAIARPVRGPRLAVVTNGGGLGVLAVDELLERGGELAVLGDATMSRLGAALPPNWSRGNPVDIVGDAPPERFAVALDAVLADRSCDGVLVLHCPTAVSAGLEAARAVAGVAARSPDAALFTSWIGEQTARAARAELHAAGVPTYATPEHAVRAFMHGVHYRLNQELLLETPPSQPELAADVAAVDGAFAAAGAASREWLAPGEVRDVLEAYGVPTVRAVPAATPGEAGREAERLAGPVALKIVSRDLVHKSDVGGVALDLIGAAVVQRAAEVMLERVRAAAPDARIEGFTVEPMVAARSSLELIVGASSRGDFGPMLLFGEGGAAVEVVADTTLELPPLNLSLARRMIERTRVYREMRGFRHVPPVAVDAVLEVLIRVSRLIVDWPRIAELEVNPLLASSQGCVALDARLRLRRRDERRAQLAIRPYPRELERSVTLADGRVLLMRPIRPEDEPALLRGFSRLSDDELRARFFIPMKAMPHVTAARFTQIDYDREMAFVLAERAGGGPEELRAVARIVADPDNARAEFAIVVERELSRLGLGTMLMRRLIEYARGRGIGELYGDVLEDNHVMRHLCRSLGFAEAKPEGQVIRVSLSPAASTSRPEPPLTGAASAPEGRS